MFLLIWIFFFCCVLPPWSPFNEWTQYNLPPPKKLNKYDTLKLEITKTKDALTEINHAPQIYSKNY